MKYVTEISDASRYGITAARAAYNATLPAEIEVTPAVPASEGTEAVPAVMAGDQGCAAQIEWSKAANVHRDHPLVAMVQQAFGWTDAEVDALFAEADAV